MREVSLKRKTLLFVLGVLSMASNASANSAELRNALLKDFYAAEAFSSKDFYKNRKNITGCILYKFAGNNVEFTHYSVQVLAFNLSKFGIHENDARTGDYLSIISNEDSELKYNPRDQTLWQRQIGTSIDTLLVCGPTNLDHFTPEFERKIAKGLFDRTTFTPEELMHNLGFFSRKEFLDYIDIDWKQMLRLGNELSSFTDTGTNDFPNEEIPPFFERQQCIIVSDSVRENHSFSFRKLSDHILYLGNLGHLLISKGVKFLPGPFFAGAAEPTFSSDGIRTVFQWKNSEGDHALKCYPSNPVPTKNIELCSDGVRSVTSINSYIPCLLFSEKICIAPPSQDTSTPQPSAADAALP